MNIKPITERPIRIALIGCGRIAQNHFSSIQQHSDRLQLTAVCDNDPDALDKAVKEQNVDGYSSLTQMLATCNADIIAVCTPSGLHSEQTIKIAESGRHVLTEKPMATRWGDALQMVKACDEAEVGLFVVKQNRLNPTMQLLKKTIEKGRFGKIYMAAINVFWTRPQAYYDQAKWRGTWELDGGAFMNQASHYVDLAHWLLGPVESIHATMGTLARNIETEDTGTMSLRWRNGAIGSINVTMLTYPKNLEGSITILGETGSVRLGGLAVNAIEHWDFADAAAEDAAIKDASYETTSVYGFGHPLYYDNLINCLQGRAQPITDGRSGLASMELLTAAYLSARDQQTVHLPLEL